MNIESLIAASARPEPFEPSALSIWTDPWISRKLLGAHLDDSTDAASRAPAQRARALAWIEVFLPRPSRILDLGCGPGLYSGVLARRGHSVVGIDLNASSIEHARAAAAAEGLDIEYRRGSYLDDELGRGYDLAMMIYCDFGALAPPKAELLLDRVREALAPGGILVFDVLGFAFGAACRPGRAWVASAGQGFWSERPHLALEETLVYPYNACVARQTVVCVEGEAPATYRTWDRYFEETEIAALLAGHGFRTTDIAKNLVAENDFGSADVIFVAAERI